MTKIEVPLFYPLVIFMFIVATQIYTYSQEPSLPKGLESYEKTSNEPTLPKGLHTSGDQNEPQLPQGIDGLNQNVSSEPQLPLGLEQESKEKETYISPEEKKGKIPFDFELKGFVDNRTGLRIREDSQQSKDFILGESRLQLKAERFWDKVDMEVTADTYGDFILEELQFDLRQARLTWTISPEWDLRIGRQILTWGTGDLLFINDLFPKDWNSFFVGREQEYLKAPSDSIKVGWYPEWANIELVYTPKFNPDRFITGEPITYWNPLFNQLYGEDQKIRPSRPDTYFQDDEWALRAYRKVGDFETAFYTYIGRWKSPAGQHLIPPLQPYFPKLNVYGASIRGPVGKGILSVELGYYDSKEDRSGKNAFVNNSEFRFLVGYEQEIAKDFTGALQIYWERLCHYDEYQQSLLPWIHPRDENRLVTTLRLTRQLMNQNLIISWFMYYSPTDQDAYFRPNVRYKVNDRFWVEVGGNIFVGNEPYTFFGQFMDNSNIYIGARWYF